MKKTKPKIANSLRILFFKLRLDHWITWIVGDTSFDLHQPYQRRVLSRLLSNLCRVRVGLEKRQYCLFERWIPAILWRYFRCEMNIWRDLPQSSYSHLSIVLIGSSSAWPKELDSESWLTNAGDAAFVNPVIATKKTREVSFIFEGGHRNIWRWTLRFGLDFMKK